MYPAPQTDTHPRAILFQALLSLTQDMAAAAGSGDWARVAALERDRAAVLAECFAAPIDADERPMLARCVQAVLAADAGTIARAEQVRAELGEATRALGQGLKARDAYAAVQDDGAGR